MAIALASRQEHTPWNCRWGSPGQHITGYSEAPQPEQEWVCERDGDRHRVTPQECAACSHWEAAAVVSVPPQSAAASRLASDLDQRAAAGRDAQSIARFATRAAFVLIAIVFVAIGVTVLTSPLAVPFTVFMFLCAAALVGWAVLLPDVDDSR